jgi:hypothetical protein
MAHLYKKRAANHWKRPPRFERRESEQAESQPLRKTGRPRSLKDITEAYQTGRVLSGPASGAGEARGGKGYRAGERHQG